MLNARSTARDGRLFSMGTVIIDAGSDGGESIKGSLWAQWQPEPFRPEILAPICWPATKR